MDTTDPAYSQAIAFFDGKPRAFGLFESLAELLRGEYPATEIQVKKTQISFVDRHIYACASMMRAKRKSELPDEYVVVTFSAPESICSERVAQQVMIRPGRWTVHIVVGDPSELDDELLGWVDVSHALATGR